MGDSGLSAKQELYLDWLCTAPGERVPPSKRAFAEEHGTTTQTLRNWEKSQAFRDVWRERVDRIQGSPERTQQMLDTLFKAGLGGDTKSAALWLQATNRMAPQQVKVESSSRVAELSDAELKGLIAAAAASQLQQRDGRPFDVV